MHAISNEIVQLPREWASTTDTNLALIQVRIRANYWDAQDIKIVQMLQMSMGGHYWRTTQSQWVSMPRCVGLDGPNFAHRGYLAAAAP